MLARAHKKFQRGQYSEIYLLTLKEQDKTKMELPLDMVSISASICRTIMAIWFTKFLKRATNIGKVVVKGKRVNRGGGYMVWKFRVYLWEMHVQ